MPVKSSKETIFAETPIFEAVMKLAVPTIIGQIIMVIYNMADTYFVSLTGSDVKITAVTVCMPAFMFLSAISNLFGIGACSVIARYLGLNRTDEARQASSYAFYGCILTTLVYSLLVVLFHRRFIDLLGGSDPQVHYEAYRYLMITVVAGGLITSISALFSHILRAQGWAARSSAGVVLGGVINMLLDPLFMFVILPKGNEVAGAAIATAISNLITLVYFTVIILINQKTVIMEWHPQQNINPAIIKGILAAGLPACLMTLFENISYAVLDNLMSASGTSLQAGLGIAKKINMLAHCIARGMSQGVMPLIGYNYSAGNHTRMRKAVTISASLSAGLAALCMLAGLFASQQLVGLFIRDMSDSLLYGAAFLRILCIGGPFSALAYSIISFFQAVGQGTRSFVLALLRKGILDIPLMFILRQMIPVYGIVMATPIADTLCCIAAICMIAAFLKRTASASAPMPA